MKTAIEVLRYVGLAAFGGLAFACVWEWRRRSAKGIKWAAIAFGSLTAIGVIGLVLQQPSTRGIAAWLIKALLVVLILFPYFLYRFAVAFQPPRRVLALVARLATLAVVVYSFALPSIPIPGQPEPAWWIGYRVAILVQWTVLFSIVAWQLWRAARGEATVTRRRMRTLALAAVGLNLAILLSGVASPRWEGLRVLTQVLSLLSSGLFFVGLVPPAWLLHSWRRTDSLGLQKAMGDLFRARTQAEVTALILPHAVRVIGARGAALVTAAGEILGRTGITPDPVEIERLATSPLEAASDSVHRVRIQAGTMFVWTSPYAPFFGREDHVMLEGWGMFVDLAMERCAFADRQRTFIANAAHELRTPLTTILGVSNTLVQRRNDLTDGQVEELNVALDRQGERAVRLINNLLDLAQLESGRLPTSIEPVSLSAAAKRALLVAPPPEGTNVHIQIDPRLAASADPERLEQILVNLLVNSYRYARSDVLIETRDEGDAVILVVSDGGPGVQEEMLPYLFEPFTRGSSSRYPGSGLGLAISRRLAEAFGGMMWYTPREPSGACFNVRLRRAA